MQILAMMTLTWHFLQKCQCLYSIERMNRNLIFTDGWFLYIFTIQVSVKMYKYDSPWYSLRQRWSFWTLWRDIENSYCQCLSPIWPKMANFDMTCTTCPILVIARVRASGKKKTRFLGLSWFLRIPRYHTSYKYQYVHRKTVTCIFLILSVIFSLVVKNNS